jgi:hypothetical protein
MRFAGESGDGLGDFLQDCFDVGGGGADAQPLLGCAMLGETASTMSNGTIWVSSPRWPGAKTPPATVIVRVMAD